MVYLLRSIARYLFSNKLLFICFSLALLFELGFEYFISLSMKFLIDEAIIPQDTTVFFIVLGIFIVGGIFNLGVGVGGDYAMAKLSERVLYGLRTDLYDHMQRLSARFYTRYRIGDIVSRFTLDIPAVEYALQQTFFVGILSGLSMVIGIVLLFLLYWKLALLAVLGSLFVLLPQMLLNRRATRVNEDYVGEVEQFANHMDEEVKGFKVIRSFTLQASFKERFNRQMERLFTLGVRRSFVNSNLERLPMAILTLVNAGILGLGGYFTFQKEMSIGDLIAFQSIFTTISYAINSFMTVIPDIIEGEVGMRRIDEFLQIEPDLEQEFSPTALPALTRDIRFEQVSFGYDLENRILQDVTLTIPIGAYVAVVGSSGSGKSTMIQLLLRFYDPQQGAIVVDGYNLKNVQLSSFLDQVGTVFQTPTLFNSTIRENLLLARPDATEAELIEAADAAGIHDFITQLPQGFDSLIINEGENLSSGERHRLAIAQTLLRKPQLLLLDEATSALDPETESYINETINRYSSGRTLINITHRLNTVAHADLIYVFDNGRAVESGHHEQLLKQQGHYYHLWRKQQGFILSEGGNKAMIEAERLGLLPFFKDMEPAILSELATSFATEKREQSETIIRQGDKGDKFYIIVRGKVEVVRMDAQGSTKRIAVLEDGEHFGEIALLRDVPRTAHVITLTHCVFLTLTREQLLPLLDRFPMIREQLERTLLERI